MTKREQIQWIVDWYYDEPWNTCPPSLCATDYYLQGIAFEAYDGDLNQDLWRSRIRDAAKKIGLTGVRIYNAESSASAGIPLFSVVYN